MAHRSEPSHGRSYFYVGGEYLLTPIGHVRQNQMYVERLTPRNGSQHRFPIIFIHGAYQSGSVSTVSINCSSLANLTIPRTGLVNLTGTRDGPAGFLNTGMKCKIDQPHVGRSAWYPSSDFPMVQYPVELIQSRFTATAKHDLWPQAHLHTQWPGVGLDPERSFSWNRALRRLTTSRQE